ncbi:MAG: 30S ribosomal protein S19e [Nanoarchaeota archaeon]|nr:30S ribosomal protein S19e [Nanoarchaeota archaeon]
MTIYDVDPTELIEGIAEELKKVEEVKPPVWASFVKTGVHKERPPVREDWWYVRAASVLRKVRLLGPVGVSKLRTLYGGKQSRGYKSEIFKRGAGNLLRKMLQQLEKAELVKQDKKGVHKGRVVTPKGIKLIDNVINKISKKPAKVDPAPKEQKPAEKPKGAPKTEEKAPKKEEKKDATKAEEKSKEAKPVEKPEVKEAPKEEPKKEEKNG